MWGAYRCTGATNRSLIDNLWRAGIITDKEVRSALLSVDRKNYCRSPATAYDDAPQPIGWSITISAPHMHARALQEMRQYLRPGCRALDVGSGSGYLTAAMASLVGPNGCATGIDHVEELVEWSQKNVKRDGKQKV